MRSSRLAAETAASLLSNVSFNDRPLVPIQHQLRTSDAPLSAESRISTANLVADRLRAAGYDVTTGVGKTGVVGLLRNGDGPTVMLRADMDALPIQEATGLAYASKAMATDREGRRSPSRTCAATICT